MKKYLYTTLVTNEKFLSGLLYFYEFWKRTNSKYEFIAMVTNNLTEEQLKKINHIPYKIIQYYTIKNDEYHARYSDTINKIQIFDFIEYDRICFIDTDIILFENLDYLLENFDDNFEFCSSLNKGRDLLRGEVFVIKPKKNFCSYLLKQSWVFQQYDDENIFSKLFRDNYLEYNFEYLSLKLWHDIGSIKYWEIFNFNSQIFSLLPYKFIKNFIAFYIQYKERLLEYE